MSVLPRCAERRSGEVVVGKLLGRERAWRKRSGCLVCQVVQVMAKSVAVNVGSQKVSWREEVVKEFADDEVV